MALLEGLANLGLVFLGEFVVAVEKAVVLLLGIALQFIPGIDDVLDHLGGGTAPKNSQKYAENYAIEGYFVPVAPGPGLDPLVIDPSSDSEFMLLDLDLLILALCITALSTVARRGFCIGVSQSVSIFSFNLEIAGDAECCGQDHRDIGRSWSLGPRDSSSFQPTHAGKFAMCSVRIEPSKRSARGTLVLS